MHYTTKTLMHEALANIKTLIYNLCYFKDNSPYDGDRAALRNLVLSLPQDMKCKYADECAFVESMPLERLGDIMFPYPAMASQSEKEPVVAGKDGGLPFVVHKQQKLFFPKSLSPSGAQHEYLELVEQEGLLGTGRLKKSPHCYQDDDFKIEKGDILLDIGCAEAIFALDNINTASKVYLFECLSAWRKPLERTFAPYTDKTVLLNKLVTDKTHGNSITLVDAVSTDMSDSSHFFVKMDIEGWERSVIKGNADFLQSAKVKLSCCVYHRQDDAQTIDTMLKKMGYRTRFSNGYMLPTINGIHYPYFRHGVIYAQNY